MSKTATLALLFTATALLSACGGGSGGAGASSPPPPTQTDLAEAAAAGLTSLADPAKGSVLLQWTDTFPSGTTYTVESRTAAGSFTPIDTVNGAGHPATLSWTHPLDGLSALRVMAHISTRSVSLKTPSHAETVSAAVPAPLPGIVVDQVGPLTGTVHPSLADRVRYRSVSWYGDDQAFATTTAPGASTTWNTPAPNGAHVLSARIETAPDSRVEIRRDVEISNSVVKVAFDLWGDLGRTDVDIAATSEAGMEAVMASLDGAPPVVLHAPNSCGRHACGQDETPRLYGFAFDDATNRGPHTLQVSATDRANVMQSLGVPFVIFDTTFTPSDGTIVFGTLDLAGSANHDSASVVVNARLDDIPVLENATSPFSTHFDLSSVPPGEHQLVLDVDDVDYPHATIARTVVVASRADMAGTPVMTLGAHGQMLAADGDLLLYAAADGAHVRDTATGADTLLAGSATVANAGHWQMDGGLVFADGADSDCDGTCIYQWSPDGSRTNVSALDPRPGAHYEPSARFGYVAWENMSSDYQRTLTLYDVATAGYTTIEGSGQDPVIEHFAGALHVYSEVSANDFGFGGTLYDWSQATGRSTVLADGAFCFSALQSDGQRLVCKGYPNGVRARPLAGGDSTFFEFWVIDLHARDGVIAMTDGWDVWAVDAAGNVIVLASASPDQGFRTYGSVGGVVAFSDDAGLETWNAATGLATRRLDARPNQALLTANALYFSLGESNVVYKVALP
jgi:hypothetical protein